MQDDMYTDDYLNLFIDEQLEKSEMDALHEKMLSDEYLRERVCQLKAVRELVNYAYETLPADHQEAPARSAAGAASWMGMVASVFVLVGVLAGWFANNIYHDHYTAVSSQDVFKYFKHTDVAAAPSRSIILHVTTGDITAVSSALNEAEQLIASYRQAGTELKLDIITYRDGVNMLRVGSSPYISRLESLLATNSNVAVYACTTSIEKMRKREGRDIVLMPRAIKTNTAQELITERLEKGWIYIKA